MTYRDWQSYQEALASYEAAKAEYASASEQWKARGNRFDKDSDQFEAVRGVGCLSIVLVGVFIFFFRDAGSLWGWGIVWFVAFCIYAALDEKCRAFQKRRFLETTPCPRFTLQEPTYHQPGANSEPPPRRAQKPQRRNAEITLDIALTALGLSQGATLVEVKSAYRARIREYHPDKVAHLGSELTELAERKSKEINAAYELLTASFQARAGS